MLQKEAEPKPTKISFGWNSKLLPAFFINLVDVLGMTIIIPLLPFYAEKYGASALEVGLLVSVFALCQLIGGPILGKLSDSMGRKPLLVISQIGSLVGFLILANASSLIWIFISRVIDGFTAGNISLVQAHISDTTAPEERAQSFAMLGIAFGIGFFIGPAVSGFLSQYSYSYPIYVAAALSAFSILLTLKFMPSQEKSAAHHDKPSPGLFDLDLYLKYFRQPVLANILVQWLMYSLAFAVFTSGFALFAERRFSTPGHHFGVKEVGYVLCYVGFLGIVLPPTLTGRLIHVLGDVKTVRLSLVCLTAGYGGLALVRNVFGLGFTQTAASFGGCMARPVLTSMITKNAPRTEQGAVLGISQSLMALAQIVGPVFSGLLIEHNLLSEWAILAGLLCIACLFLTLRPR
jgi:MFS family permease